MSEHYALPAADLCRAPRPPHPLPRGMIIPGQPEARAAWLSLPAETRDSIGVLAVEHVFGMYLAAENFFADTQTFRLDLRGQSGGLERADAAINEMAWMVPEALPVLFGQPEQEPAWITDQAVAAMLAFDAPALRPWQRVNARVAEVALAALRLEAPPPALRRAALMPTIRCADGADPVGGAVEFAEAVPLDANEGEHGWLAVHLSSFFDMPATSADFYATAPYDPEGAPYLGRIGWVREREEMWRRIAADPFQSLEWAGGDVLDPWSALAAVFEWVRYLDSPAGMHTRLPVVVEARCIRTMLPADSTLKLESMPEWVRGLPGAVLMARGEGMVVADAGGGVFATHARDAWRLAWFIKDGIESA